MVDDLPKLTSEEMELCRKTFSFFDANGSGTIDVKEMKSALVSMGHNPSDEDVFVMVAEVDKDGSKEIDFQEFLMAMQINKAKHMKDPEEDETVDAWMVLGGKSDKTGTVAVQRFLKFIKDFELKVDVKSLLGDEDNAKTEMSFAEFEAVMK